MMQHALFNLIQQISTIYVKTSKLVENTSPFQLQFGDLHPSCMIHLKTYKINAS